MLLILIHFSFDPIHPTQRQASFGQVHEPLPQGRGHRPGLWTTPVRRIAQNGVQLGGDGRDLSVAQTT